VKKYLLFLACSLWTHFSNAQSLDDEVFVIDLKINGTVVNTFLKEPCGFSTTGNGWGFIPPLISTSMPVVWAYDITPDSLCCDSIPNDYTGKMVMIRRGACEFAHKALRAQIAGASAVAIVNGTAATHGDDCNQPSMGGGIVCGLVTIPTVMLSRIAAEEIDVALKAGLQPEICFRRLSLYDATAEYSHLTPVGQEVSVDLLSMRCINRTGIEQAFVGKFVITDPAGNVTELTSDTIVIAANVNALLPANASYSPPSGLTGVYTVRYTADKVMDEVLYRTFRITPHTWGTDNLVRNGGALNNDVVPGVNIYISGSVVVTGATIPTVEFATFGIENAAAIADTITPETNIVNVILYDADTDDDNINDLGSGISAFDALNVVAFADVSFNKETTKDLQDVALIPLSGTSIPLKPNHLYYIALKYDGNNNATALGKSISFSATRKVFYDQRIGLHTPLIIDDAYDGWSYATVITRLHEKGYIPSVIASAPVLDKIKYTITPNPTTDFVNFNLDLTSENETVVVQILDHMGRTISTQVKKNFKSGRVSFDGSRLPSGNYVAYVRTSNEGSVMTHIQICH
jgi:hypothetical protein